MRFHEEFIKVVGEDSEEPHSLKQWREWIISQLKHTMVELKPGEIAIEISLDGVHFRFGGYSFFAFCFSHLNLVEYLS